MTTYRVPHRLAFVVPDESDAPVAFLMPLPDGHPLVLHDTAALIWVLAADGDPDVVAAVVDVVGASREEVEGEVQNFLGDLVDTGLLERLND